MLIRRALLLEKMTAMNQLLLPNKGAAFREVVDVGEGTAIVGGSLLSLSLMLLTRVTLLRKGTAIHK